MILLSQQIIQQHFIRSDNASVMRDKGQALEDLIAYIFGQIPGMELRGHNIVNIAGSEEIDLAFWNDKSKSGIEFLPYIILIECKNWSKSVDSVSVNWFDTKLRNRGLTFGILVAAAGITGNPSEKTAAHEIIRSALSQGRQLIVITRQEIEVLNSTLELINMIKNKLCQLAVSGTVLV